MRWPFRRDPSVPLGSYGSALFRRRLGLSGDELNSHMHVIGKSGSGKSRWLASLYVNLLKAGMSATLIDPHGDLSRLVLAQLVADGYFDRDGAFERLVYLDVPTAAKRGRFLRFNCLKQPHDTHTTTRLTLEALRRAFPTLDGGVAPAFEQIVTAGVHVLVEHGLPLPLLRPLLLPSQKAWRDGLLARVQDNMVRSFFWDEYDRYDARERMHLQGSTLRRLFLLLYNPVLRFGLAAKDNLLEYRSILDRNQSLIVNLAIPDPDTRRLLGCLLTVFAEEGAKSRADLPPGSRFGTHYLMLDESQLFVAQSAAALTEMLSQTRKYALFAVLSHQTMDQFPERLRGALQNVEVDVTFRIGREDAEQTAKAVGAVDPLAVKKEEPVYFAKDGEATIIDYRSRELTLAEQWEAWTKRLERQPKRHAFIRHPNGSVTQVKALPMPDPVVDVDRLAAIEERYLTHYFQADPVPMRDEDAAPQAADHAPLGMIRRRRAERVG